MLLYRDPSDTQEDEPNCGMPVDIVNGGCNSPIGADSDCCVASADPGCNDPACTGIVCAIDPFCCDEQWDAFCAATALELCASCANIEYPMEPITCGETYCATSGSSGSMRDVDWYKLQLEEDSFVEVTATCDFSPIFGIIDNFGIDSCEDLEVFVTSAIGLPCEETTVATFLPAGTWYLLVAQSSFDVLPCETDYQFTVTCTQPGACCFGDGTCFQRDEVGCLKDGGVYLGAGIDCFELDGPTSSFTSTPDVMIPDGNTNGVTDRLTIDESVTIGRLTVDLQIDHTWIEDVTVTLTHESSGTSAVIWRRGCLGAQSVDATFSDDADPVECAWPVTTGVINPLSVNGAMLGQFQGIDASGEWTLHVYDSVQPDFGRLKEWTINIETGDVVDCEAPGGRCCRGCASDCGRVDGVVDMLDLMALLEAWNTPSPCATSDSGLVDFDALLQLLHAWGDCPIECQITSSGDCDALGGTWLEGADCDSEPCDL